MEQKLKQQLIALAGQYEQADFILDDPIQIPHRHKNKVDIEVSALVTSWISTGNRKAIIKKADEIDRNLFENKPYHYIISQKWERSIGNKSSFYRYYSFHDFYLLCNTLFRIYQEHNTLEEYLCSTYPGMSPLHKLQSAFGHINGMPDIASSSEAKKMCMFLRWMVRQNSPVDFGIWKQFSAETLLIPLDTHVHRIATELGLIGERKSLKAARYLTNTLREIWPNDPVKGDFALFGYGVNESSADRALSTGKNNV